MALRVSHLCASWFQPNSKLEAGKLSLTNAPTDSILVFEELLMHTGKYIGWLVLLAMLAGCTSYPFDKNLRDDARPFSMTQVQANPKTTRGSTVIWGGRIIRTINGTNGGEIYVLQLPLNRRERPGSDDTASGGRFIAVSSEFLDPAVYAPGRLISMAGQLEGVRDQFVANVLYAFPVVRIKQSHLWTSPAKG